MNLDTSNEKPFTNREVMTMFESLRGDISLIAEDVTSLRQDVTILKSDVAQLKSDMIVVKDVLRIEIPRINSRLTALESKAS